MNIYHGRLAMSNSRLSLWTITVLAAYALIPCAWGQWRVMPLGDSITQGYNGFASYRYWLWQSLQAEGRSVDFVGPWSNVFGGDNASIPFPAIYSNYYTTFDRDHAGSSSIRTDQVLAQIGTILSGPPPQIVLYHLGTNDIGQNGASGVTAALANLPLIVGHLRAANPNVTVLVAQIIPIGPGTFYFSQAAEVTAYNAALPAAITAIDTPASRVLLVDQSTGFNPDPVSQIHMQSDGLHPNAGGEQLIASVWLPVLRPWVSGTPPPPPPPAAAALGFEVPALGDGAVAQALTSAAGTATLSGWEFSGGAGTYAGIFNPPASTYSAASGANPPTGAEGSNAAYLVYSGAAGAGSSITALGSLGVGYDPDTRYSLRVAVGRRLAGHPYLGGNFGDATVELLAGTTLLAQSAAPVGLMTGEFRDVELVSLAGAGENVGAALGSTLRARLRLNPQAAASVHADFDHVRLEAIRPTNFTAWAAAYGLAGPTAEFTNDEDEDGVAAGLEFACGLDPTLADARPLAQGARAGLLAIDELSDRRLRIRHPRRKAISSPGIVYELQFSSTLNGPWQADPTWVVEVASANPLWEIVIATSPASQAAGFARLSVKSE
ncbi:MAG: hypothetical protein EAZ42_04045 [Verrucomicrobia bacterium]|nr:MAG: hypothetical protein EAZ42_04045 [Verrucomicrobiota bacterium]